MKKNFRILSLFGVTTALLVAMLSSISAFAAPSGAVTGTITVDKNWYSNDTSANNDVLITVTDADANITSAAIGNDNTAVRNLAAGGSTTTTLAETPIVGTPYFCLNSLSLNAADCATNAAKNKADAVVAQIVSRTIWTGLFFFWGIAFVLIGGALVIQKRLNSIVAWIFVVFGTLFVILSVTPIELAQNVGFLIFGIMSLNTVIAGVLRLRETQD